MNLGPGTNPSESESLVPDKPEPWAVPSRDSGGAGLLGMLGCLGLGATVRVPSMGDLSNRLQNQDLSNVSRLFTYFQTRRRNRA